MANHLFYSSVISLIVLDLHCCGRSGGQRRVSYIIMIFWSVGIVFMWKIVRLVWSETIYISISNLFAISHLEIHLNLQISSVFWQISLCILWNPWISVLNLQYSKLKSIKLCHFELFFNCFYLLSSCTIVRCRGKREIYLNLHSLDLF